MRSFTWRLAPRWSVLAVFAVGGAGLAALGCGSIAPVEPQTQTVTDPKQIYTQLTLNYNAINLSSDTTTDPAYYSVQLVATPRDAQGNPMTGLPAPTYKSLDTARVEVMPAGLLRAKAVTEGTPVTVTVSLTQGPVTHTDMAMVNVTDLLTPPQLSALSIELADSAVHAVPPPLLNIFAYTVPVFDYVPSVGVGGTPLLAPDRALATDPLGNSISGLVIEYRSLDPTIGTISRWDGSAQVQRPGQLRLVAQTMAYGIVKADTVVFTVTMPPAQNLLVVPGINGVPTFSPNEIRIAPYGHVLVANYIDDTVDVTFDDDPHMIPPIDEVCGALAEFQGTLDYFMVPGAISCSVGDMLLLPFSRDPAWAGVHLPALGSLVSLQARHFSVPGVYRFHSARLGISGRVVVSTDAPADQ